MGEESAEKSGDVLLLPPRQRHSSAVSSCSEDSEAPSGRLPDEEEGELEYGPGIVSKLKTRFLSMSLRGAAMKRSCSMENLLEQNSSPCGAGAPPGPAWGNLKRAKSMDTLLMDLQAPEAIKKEPRLVLNRCGPTICDEELPKPDTVKTYKRMFEPAEPRRGSCSRRPPVLRASAKSGCASKVSSSAKANGAVSKSKPCAKQPSHLAKAAPLPKPRPSLTVAAPCDDAQKTSKESGRPHKGEEGGIVCNGNSHGEPVKMSSVIQKFEKSSVREPNKCKPKVPPNRPTFVRNPKQFAKSELSVVRSSESNHKPPAEVVRPQLKSKVAEPKQNGYSENIPVQAVAPKVRSKKLQEDNPRVAPQRNVEIPKNCANTNGECNTNGQQDLSKQETKPPKKGEAAATSVVFDFRGKDVVAHVAVVPPPFGCRPVKRKPLLIDGLKGLPNGRAHCAEGAGEEEDEDEYHVDYSVPLPCGLVFEGENIKVGRGSMLFTRNKDLKITFDDNVDDNTFVYPSESSFTEEEHPSPSDEPLTNGHSSPLKANTAIGSLSSGSLSSYTPSVLKTVDTFEPGMFRQQQHHLQKEESQEEEGGESEAPGADDEEAEMLKPADPGLTASWSLSAGTSDLLF